MDSIDKKTCAATMGIEMGTDNFYQRNSLKINQTLGYLKQLESSLPLIKRLNDDLLEIENQAAHFSTFDDVIILGTGGSSLAGQTIAALQTKTSPRLHFIDNIDAYSFSKVIKKTSPANTGVIAISKSGNTAETLMQLLSCFDTWQGLNFSQHFLIVSQVEDNELGDNAIRKIARQFKIPTIQHPADVGGRFSAFTVVGMLPGIIAGVDVKAIRLGALEVIESLRSAEVHSCPPLQGALMQLSAQVQGVNQVVMMCYCDRLQLLVSWYCQLFAESLGKKDANGLPQGMTPIKAVGATDQHSQLQLYLDGPRDKFFTFLTLAKQYKLPAVNSDYFEDDALMALHGKTMGQLMMAEQRATLDTLRYNNRPVRELKIENLTPKNLGALMMHLMLETLALAHWFGVNPLNQPAVEHGKKLALVYLSQS